jgi:hypothetical protein
LTRAAGEGHATLSLYLPRRLPHEHCARVGSLRNDRTNSRAELAAVASAKGEAVLCESERSPGAPHGPLWHGVKAIRAAGRVDVAVSR